MNRFSLFLRLWHWLNAVVVLGLLGTFFLRKTFLSWRDNSQILLQKLAEFDIIITQEQAKALAKAVRAPMWEWHIILGVVFTLLLLIRWIMIFKDGFGFPKNDTTHMQWVYRLYKVMYTIFTIMAISGLILAFYTSLGIDKEIAHQIKEMHETLAWSVVAFVVLHLGGVIAAEQKNQKGIVSQMISG